MNNQSQNRTENGQVQTSSDSLTQSLQQTSHRIGVIPVPLDWDVIDQRLTQRRKFRRRIKSGGFLAVLLAIGWGTFYVVGREPVGQPLAQQINTLQPPDKSREESDRDTPVETTQTPTVGHDLIERSGGSRAVDYDMLESINQRVAHFQLMQQLQQQVRQEERNYYELVRSRAESDFLRSYADSF